MDATGRREFLEFCRAGTPALFRVAYGLTAHQQLAEDLLQTALEREVAEILGCTPSTVSSQASRALARLRQLCPELSEVNR